MKTIGRDGWAHDCDGEIEARIDSAPVETAEPKPVDAEAIVASCCKLFDCRPSDLRSKIVELQATAAPVEEGATAWQDAALAHLAVVSVLMSWQDVLRVRNFINDSRMKGEKS